MRAAKPASRREFAAARPLLAFPGMKRTFVAALLCSLLAGCLVVPAGHPHGGPPGQMKKSHAHGHHHGHGCGHKRKWHKGSYVYFVGGSWCTADGVVVAVRL